MRPTLLHARPLTRSVTSPQPFHLAGELFESAAALFERVWAENGKRPVRLVGLGLMFVPLTTITLAELAPQELAQGTGLYNFFRQLGGSFGIAGISTLLLRYTAQNRATLVQHVSAFDPTSMARLQALTQGMVARGADLWTAKSRALALMDRQLMGQASVIAYGRIYVLSAIIILVLIPLLLLVRTTKGASGAHPITE